MQSDRRSFIGGALSAALGSQFGSPAVASASAETATLAAIRAFGEADLLFNGLPAMTLGLVTPDGRRTVLNFGYANRDTHLPITADTLFQVGSITKLMVAALLHQFAAEGRLKLTSFVSDLLPELPLPADNLIQVQHLLDHVAGLAGDVPVFAQGGLWTGYAPGAHWYYSNSGYEILGKLAEHLGGRPLDQLLSARIFAPLGMTRARGAIVGADRPSYAQGYQAADQLVPYTRGVALAPAPWVDVTFGAGCVASTAWDMMALLRALASAAQGKGGLGLSPEHGRIFAAHAVSSDTPAMTYGNGLMHVADGRRSYLHHTGGMLSFSSSFHLDVDSGIGAFASTPLNAFAEYRPRLLTKYAVDAMADLRAGRPVPPPPPIDPPLIDAASYLGRYSGPDGSFEVRSGKPLTIIAGGQWAPLIQWSDDIFHTSHPQFRNFSLMFERSANSVASASWGGSSFARNGAQLALAPSNPALRKFAGTYINDNPWFGPCPVVERGGKLWIGTETPMTRIGDNLWRVGKESWSPERASFANLIDGRPQSFTFSAVTFDRRDV